MSKRNQRREAQSGASSSAQGAARATPRRLLLLAVTIAAGLFAAWQLWPSAFGYVLLPAYARGTLALSAACAPLVLFIAPVFVRALREREWMAAFWILVLAPVTVLLNLMALTLVAHVAGGTAPLQWLPVIALGLLWLVLGLMLPRVVREAVAKVTEAQKAAQREALARQTTQLRTRARETQAQTTQARSDAGRS